MAQELRYCAVRINPNFAGQPSGNGSSFVVDFRWLDSRQPRLQAGIPTLITNVHVAMGAIDGWLNLWQRRDDGSPSFCRPVQLHDLLHPDLQLCGEGWGWTYLADPQSDIAALPLIGRPGTDITDAYYFNSLSEATTLLLDRAGQLSLGTEVVMIGYPGGQPEPGTQHPQFLYGSTIERPTEQGGRPTDAVHIVTTQGASGSPILINGTGEPLQTATSDTLALLGVVHAVTDENAIYVRGQELVTLKQYISEWLEAFEW